MQGREIELDKLIMRNETTIAVGNVKVNARGDELGPGGTILKRNDAPVRSDSVPHVQSKVAVAVPQPIVPPVVKEELNEDDTKPKQKQNAIKSLATSDKKD